ncbi:unnamed protein product [Caenorhabditis auriculariae]|uniref:Uncharacterized protein n=1 Tax=Caenorhabditis auriculariae TaxID=2777116 RepID=A0A8S1H3K1_9PELO|nr:unnamed protein product [Caenorhabditis auriculariae]
MSRSFGVHDAPPHAANTVTISTSNPPQQQLRPMAMPLRAMPQPVSIRKINDAAPLTSKEEPLDDFPGTVAGPSSSSAGTSSGPLSVPSTSVNTFQQYQRGAVGGALAGLNHGGNGLLLDQHVPAPINLASKVAEVFLTAGHAFQKLGDLTLQLHTTTDSDESKWSDKEVDHLRDALTKFAHELDQISTSVASRAKNHIKADIKRRHFDDSHQPQIKRMAGVGGTTLLTGTLGNPNYGGLTATTSMGAIPLAPKRVAMPPTGKIVNARQVVTGRYAVAGTSMSTSPSPVSLQMPHLQQQQAAPSAANATNPTTSTLTTGLAASAAGYRTVASSWRRTNGF